jgi:hypothetical protein
MAPRIPTYHFGPHLNEKLDKFVNEFQKLGFERFEQEFAKIDEFVGAARCESQDRDAHELRLTTKLEYLLEMVSFRIYDELNRDAFNKAKGTLIIIPDCLSIHETPCEKVEKWYGSICKQCLGSCQAAQIVKLAALYKAKAVFSKRKLERQLKYYRKKMGGDIGVIGVACVLMLAHGMRTAADLDIPARGVLLNFSGCEHWNDDPNASEVTLSSLRSILEEKYGK